MKLFYALLCGVCFAACGTHEASNTNTTANPAPTAPDSQTPAQPAPAAINVSGPATYYSQTGSDGSGCGVPVSLIESQDYVALNIQNTPHNYGQLLPLPITNPAQVGAYKNGLNCGRWIKVTTADGASLDMLVTDSCPDSNNWCRDDFYHIDMHETALVHFIKNGRLESLWPGWDNPVVSWHFEPAPNYHGDVKITFRSGSNYYWQAVNITNLPNGIHGVDALVNGQWVTCKMGSINGQIYTLPGNQKTATIRIYDADDKLIFGGKTYSISY